MNNNRGNNRRRGRGGNRQQGNPNQQNRIDNRARGNAPQLLEKYKKLAHDAQLNGDRVQMEYYLQFADHYFRVIADNKARKDEAQAKRDEERGSGDDDHDSDDAERGQSGQRGRRRSRDDRDDRDSRDNDASDEANDRDDDDDDHADVVREVKPRRRARKPVAEKSAGNGLDPSALPPAISASDDGGDEAPKPRRRARKKPADEAKDDSGDEAMAAAE